MSTRKKVRKITITEIIFAIVIAIETTILSGCGTTGKVAIDTSWTDTISTITEVIK